MNTNEDSSTILRDDYPDGLPCTPDLPSLSLTEPGAFVVGCNYWASHAGTAMWRDWRPDVVDADLKQLADAGLQTLRVFPLWPDFQPITQLYTGAGRPMELRHGEAPLPDDAAGRAGVSTEAMARFAAFADLAERHGLKLIVGLVTGWMSGRLFVPPGLEGRNVLTDPVAIMWQVRFVQYFVRRFREHHAILAWDLGNECNCMGLAPSHEAAWTWTAALASAIRAEDRTRPLVSGMHSLDEPDRARANWTIADQAELTDILTTHPYPYFTPHTDQDPVNTIRTVLHATAQTRWYGDCGGKPALTEEIGTLGPMVASEQVAADFARNVLFSLWAHDCHGLLWWCAYDQGHLTHAPYDWHAFERELGLIRADRSPKPVLAEIGRFAQFLADLPIHRLPPRITEAVCVLTHEQDQWGAAYSSFVLAKQTGFDIEFQYDDQPLKPAALYLVPSVSGGGNMARRTWQALLARVRDGATLYLSHNTAMLSPFGEAFGLEVQTRGHTVRPVEFRLAGVDAAFTANAPIRLALQPTHAEVLACEADGNPILTRAAYGRGRAYFLGVPIELDLANRPGGFHAPDAAPWWRIYREIGEPFLAGRAVRRADPFVGLTEHPLDEARRIVVAINYRPEPREVALDFADPWTAGQVWRGPGAISTAPETAKIWLPPNDAAVFIARKMDR
jgi:hypothetical protein